MLTDIDHDAEALCAEGVYSIPEAIEFCGVSRAELYRRMESGEIPHLMRGRRRLIPRVGLRRWLAAGLRSAGTSAG
ncbi:MAG: helix-turn-helix domain-containing protein [Myxococcota bacterium]|nr:helix-turn-helix domain-containing protein [Myxococcota bacterium]